MWTEIQLVPKVEYKQWISKRDTKYMPTCHAKILKS